MATSLERPIIVDTREQTPWDFHGLRTLRRKLDQGDYSLLDLVDVVAIERKTLGDYVSSITTGRQRFRRELERLREKVVHPIIFVEASRKDVEEQLYRNRVHPNAVVGTALSMWVDYGVPVWWCANRRLAQADAIRLFMDIERGVACQDGASRNQRSTSRHRNRSTSGACISSDRNTTTYPDGKKPTTG